MRRGVGQGEGWRRWKDERRWVECTSRRGLDEKRNERLRSEEVKADEGQEQPLRS
jgi:hypothetical protein